MLGCVSFLLLLSVASHFVAVGISPVYIGGLSFWELLP